MKTILLILTVLSIESYAQPTYDDHRNLLDDEHVNPTFAALLKRFMDSAKLAGFKPVVHEAYRSRERAVELHKKAKPGRPAAKVSVHSFGLAADLWLANDKGEAFSYDAADYANHTLTRFSFSKWKKFIRIGESFGLINGEKNDDTDHWEYHPNWSKTKWVSAAEKILPIYNRNSKLTEKERLQEVWTDAGL